MSIDGVCLAVHIDANPSLIVAGPVSTKPHMRETPLAVMPQQFGLLVPIQDIPFFADGTKRLQSGRSAGGCSADK